MERLTDLSLGAFSDRLASQAPVPGGGGAAALAGALGTALCEMAGNLTLGRTQYAAVEADVRRMLDQAEELRLRLISLVEEDAEGFRPLAEAYSIPKDAPERAARLEAATLKAMEAPLAVMRSVAAAIALTEEMLEKGNRQLVSDVGCAALLCQAALECAAMNVLVNTRTLPKAAAAPAEAEAEALLGEYHPRARAVADGVFRRLAREDGKND